MEELKPGAVVYLRGDLKLETPLTVTGVTADAVHVLWLDAEKQAATWYSPREVFMTAAEAARDMVARKLAERAAADDEMKRHSLKKPYGNFEGY
jgi:hypothetical protein